MKRLFFLFIVLLFQCTLPYALIAKSTLKVGIYNNEPLIFIDANGQGKGFFADIIEHVADSEGWQIEYVAGTWQQCLSRLENNQIDILCTIAYSEVRDKLYDFNRENLLTNWGQLYTPVGSDIKAVTEVAGKKVAVLKGDVHYTIFNQIMDRFGIACEFIETDDYHSVLDLVSRRQVDAGVVNRFFGMKYRAKYNVDKSGVIFNPIKIHFAVPDGKNNAIMDRIDHHIALLKNNDNSIYYRSLERWFDIVSGSSAFFKWAKWILTAALGLVIFLFLGNLVLRSRVKARTKEMSIELNRRKSAEEELRNEKNFTETALDSQQDTFFLFDPDTGKAIRWNKAFTDITGYSDQEVAKMSALDAYHSSQDLQRASNAIKKVLEAGSSTIELDLICKDGRKVPTEYNASKIKDEEGKPKYVICIGRDVTERKLAEAMLKESEEKFSGIFQSSPAGMVITALTDGKVFDVNESFTRITGYGVKEAIGRTSIETGFWINPDDREKATQRLKENGFFKNLEFNFRNKAGEILLGSCSSKIISIKGEKFIITAIEDITEQKRIEAQFQQAQKMEAIGTLAGGIAHDFNNLLMGIQGRTSMMLFDANPDSENIEHLKGIEEYVKSATDLTKQLLGFARGGKYEVKPTNLNELIKKKNVMFGRMKKEITIREKFEKDLWPAKVDRGQFEQVLLNLYINAWQAMPGEGELYIQTENITLDAEYLKPFEVKPGKFVKISVTDTGIGIDKAIQQRIFDPFFTTKGVRRGVGLGLASVYGIIKNHGGFINLYSEKGEGTTFDIYLPASSEAAIEKAQMAREKIQYGSGTILLVDDEKMISDVGKKMIQKLGYDVITAGSGNEALALYEENQHKIDLVVLDMIMPDMGGGETYNRLKAMNPDIRVILSSGYSLDGKAAEILNRGCNGFIQKPFNMKQLSHKLMAALDKQ